MGKRGTKPAPTAIKKLRNVRKDRINNDEPVSPPLSADSLPPKRFKDDKRKMFLWRYYLQLFTEMKILSQADQSALEELVYHKWMSEKAEQEVKENGEVIEQVNKAKQKYFIENPWLNIKYKSSDRVTKLLTQFGLTPSSRSSIKVEKPTAKKTGLKVLMANKTA